MKATIIFAILCGAAASGGCSSSDSSPGVTAETGVDTGAGTIPTMKCGAGGVKQFVRLQNPDDLSFVAGATISSVGCNTVTTGDDGLATLDIALGTPFEGKVEAPGYFTTYNAEWKLISTGDEQIGYLLKTKFSSLLPSYTATASYAIIAVWQSDADAGACGNDGVAVSSDQPAAKVVYLSNLTPLQTDPALTMTGTKVQGAIVGPLSGTSVVITGTKPGCKVVPGKGKVVEFTGKYTLVPGGLTEGVLMVAPM